MTAILTKVEATRIQTTRTALEVIMKRVQKETRYDSTNAYDRGRLIEAIDLAEDLLFNVLNIGSSYCACENAKAALDAGRVKP